MMNSLAKRSCLTNRTILITGGSSGIGLELARRFRSSGNTVLICGRSAEKLKAAMREIPEIHTHACDLARPEARAGLFQWVSREHPDCSIIVNNAAIVHRTDFYSDSAIMEKVELEFQTNCLAPIALTKLFLPMLVGRGDGVVINTTTGLVYAPKAAYPAYGATKAALHSFTQTLRAQLRSEGVPVRVVEVLMPAVDTPWHEGRPPAIAIPVDRAVTEMVRGIEAGQDEVRVAGVKLFYALSRFSPGLAFHLINRT